MDLKNLVLNGLKEQDSQMYSEIIDFQNRVLNDEISCSRYSLIFLLDLFYASKFDSRNIDAVMHEVKCLEGKGLSSRTKQESQFRKSPLKDLWHKHYFDGSVSAMAKNIENALESYGIPYFEQRIQESNESGEQQFVKPEDIYHIVHDAVSGNLQRRREQERITGEWLIYAVHESINYYLCLAKHEEDDHIIRRRIDSSCIFEFPFLRNILPD
jgi:hypothetical protein